MSYHYATQCVLFWRQAWLQAAPPTLGRPVRVDGVMCTSKLSWLAHTLGHEMLHAMLHGMCGGHAHEAPCNTAGQGHGAAFLAVNEYVLGHVGCTYTLDGMSARGR